MKYRKKPVVIEAMELKTGNIFEVEKFVNNIVDLKTEMDKNKFEEYENIVIEKGLKIKTLEGVMTANIGDYIIKGVNGEFYPCKPDIFEKTYEKI